MNLCFLVSWLLLVLTLDKYYLLAQAATSKQKDIYDVITGEVTPPPQSLDPVYYVGIYDEKPKQIPFAVMLIFYVFVFSKTNIPVVNILAQRLENAKTHKNKCTHKTQYLTYSTILRL